MAFRHAGAFPSFLAWDRGVCSEILYLESCRYIDRTRIVRHLPDTEVAGMYDLLGEAIARMQRIPVSQTVLDRAATTFPTVVGSLDAIHLATALLWAADNPGEDFVFLTDDRGLALAARTCRLDVQSSPG